MMLLLTGLWPGLLGGLVLGLAVGRLAGPPPATIAAGLGLAGLALAGVAAAGLVPGAPGLWTESAALMPAPYLAGCALGALGRRRPPGPPKA